MLERYLKPSLDCQDEEFRWVINQTGIGVKGLGHRLNHWVREQADGGMKVELVRGEWPEFDGPVMLVRPNWSLAKTALTDMVRLIDGRGKNGMTCMAFIHGVDRDVATGRVRESVKPAGVCPFGTGHAGGRVEGYNPEDIAHVKTPEPKWLRHVSTVDVTGWEPSDELQRYFPCPLTSRPDS